MYAHEVHQRAVQTRIHHDPPIFRNPHRQIARFGHGRSGFRVGCQDLSRDKKPERTLAGIEGLEVTTWNAFSGFRVDAICANNQVPLDNRLASRLQEISPWGSMYNAH